MSVCVYVRMYAQVMYSDDCLCLSFSIQTLKALDSYVVSDEEVVENFTMTGKFATFSKELKLKRGFTSFHQVRSESQNVCTYIRTYVCNCIHTHT